VVVVRFMKSYLFSLKRKMNYSTALVVIIPVEFHDSINFWRSQYDKAYPRWMPHITLYYPFAPVDQFPDVAGRIQAAVRGFGSFELNFNQVSHFPQKNKSTIHLRVENDTKLQELFNDHIKPALPEIKLSHPTFVPHLTLAQTDKRNTNQMVNQIQEYFQDKNMKMTVNEIYLINRSETDLSVPFSIHSTISLL
jgi:2'-5' RNA ligase